MTISGSTFETFKQDDQVALLQDIAEVLDRQSFDQVTSILIESWIITPEVGALSEAIANGEEIQDCDYCSTLAPIAGQDEESGLNYCNDCKEDEE